MSGSRFLVALVGVLALTCRGDLEETPPVAARARPRAAPAQPAAPVRALPAPAQKAPVVVFFGDSISAGYGLAQQEAFPQRVGERLAERGVAARVVNAGVSGDTSSGGLARLDWVLRQRPDVLVVELGANDGLRGTPLGTLEANLRQIVERARDAGATVILTGMRLPPNYGAYGEEFAALYPRLARELDVPLVPFLLAGVGGVPELNLPDGIHPTADGHRRVAEVILPYVESALRERAATAADGSPASRRAS